MSANEIEKKRFRPKWSYTKLLLSEISIISLCVILNKHLIGLLGPLGTLHSKISIYFPRPQQTRDRLEKLRRSHRTLAVQHNGGLADTTFPRVDIKI